MALTILIRLQGNLFGKTSNNNTPLDVKGVIFLLF